MNDFIGRADVPIGFALALAENLDAMRCFSRMDENQRASVLAKAKTAKSADEMHAITRAITGANATNA